jgi:hypothetical protein
LIKNYTEWGAYDFLKITIYTINTASIYITIYKNHYPPIFLPFIRKKGSFISLHYLCQIKTKVNSQDTQNINFAVNDKKAFLHDPKNQFIFTPTAFFFS